MAIKKMIGKFLYDSIGRHMPPSHAKFSLGSEKFRRFCARLIGVDMRGAANIEKNATFASNLVIGNRSSVGQNSIIANNVTIGDDVMMGPYCIILTQNHEFSRTDINMIEQGYSEIKPVIIDDDVWIGARVTILPGIHVHEHSIIGAGAVVTHDVPAYSIVAGVPAKVIKMRK